MQEFAIISKGIVNANSEFSVRCEQADVDKDNLLVICKELAEQYLSRPETEPGLLLFEVPNHGCFVGRTKEEPDSSWFVWSHEIIHDPINQ